MGSISYYAKNGRHVVKQGGLSDGVWNSKELLSYSKNYGYVGAFERTREKDRIVEEELRATGLGDESIGLWLTSVDGRHMMDEEFKDASAFRKHVKAYVSDAFKQIVIWSFPDHKGTLASSEELSKRISEAFTKVSQ